MDQQQMYSKIDKAVEQNREQIIDFLKKLIKLPSVNPQFSEDKEITGEKKVQQFLADKLESLGAEINLWEPDPEQLKKYAGQPGYYRDRDFTDRPNLAAVFPGDDSEAPSLLLTGHADTVNKEGDWQFPAFTPTEKDGRIYGLGTADMKGGLTSLIMALHCLKEADLQPRGEIVVGSVVDEEAGGMGTLDFVEQGYKLDAGILAEPTALKIAPLCRGILWGKIRVKGRGGHIEIDQPHWQEGGSVDGIDKARYILNQLDRLNEEWAKKKQHDLLPIPCQVVPAQINGGEYPTSYANEVEIVFNAQYLPAEKSRQGAGEQVKQEIEDFIAQAAAADSWLAENPPEVKWDLDANCGATPVEHEFIQVIKEHAKQTAENITDREIIEGVTSHTDMGFFTERGIKMINYGPGQPFSAHQPDEYVSREDLITATKVVAKTIITWSGVL
jgi:acetylornithine deacetylase